VTGKPAPDRRRAARADLAWALVWMVLGAAILVESLRMDRLESQAINHYTVPGIVPGLLGIALTILGALLLGRSLMGSPHDRDGSLSQPNWRRFGIGALLFLVFALGMFGHLPFPLAAFVFVTGFILIAEWPERAAAGTLVRGALFAALCGAGTAALVTYVFQYLFLVQLP
jgi:hypothetical protein